VPFFLVAAGKDLRRHAADWPALLTWMGIPVAIGVLMFLISGSASTPRVPKAKLLLVDQDGSVISQFVGNGATSGRMAEFLDVERVALDEGKRRMANGEASAMLVVPEGFGQALLEERPSELRLVTNPAQRLLPGIVQEGLEILIEAAFYAQRLFGEPLRQLAAVGPEGPSSAEVASIATAFNERIRALDGVAFPPVLVLDIQPAASGEAKTSAAPNFGLLFVPGLLLMSVLFVVQGMSGDIWHEKQLGTLRRSRVLPASIAQWLAGKVLASTVLVSAIATVALLAAWLAFGIPAVRVPLAWVWACLSGAALLCYFCLLQVSASSERGAQLLGTLVVFPLIMIGGSFFPFEAMPAWMAAVGARTPNGLAVVRLREILDGRATLMPMLLSAVGIAGPALAAFWLTVRRLSGQFPVA